LPRVDICRLNVNKLCTIFDISPRQAKTRQTGCKKATCEKYSYFRMAGRKVAMRKHEQFTIWWVFAWRFFAFSPQNTIIRHGTNQPPYIPDIWIYEVSIRAALQINNIVSPNRLQRSLFTSCKSPLLNGGVVLHIFLIFLTGCIRVLNMYNVL